MAQYQKEEVREAILRAAKHEFLVKGFQAANLREISRKAAVPVGNLYNYFRDKDQLFTEVLQPQMRAIRTMLVSALASEQLRMDDWDYVLAHRAELDLLFNQARGSSLEDFLEQVALECEQTWQERLTACGVRKPSAFFLHSLSHFYIKAVAEMLDHDLSDRELRENAEELIRFTWSGLRSVGAPA